MASSFAGVRVVGDGERRRVGESRFAGLAGRRTAGAAVGTAQRAEGLAGIGDGLAPAAAGSHCRTGHSLADCTLAFAAVAALAAAVAAVALEASAAEVVNRGRNTLPAAAAGGQSRTSPAAPTSSPAAFLGMAAARREQQQPPAPRPEIRFAVLHQAASDLETAVRCRTKRERHRGTLGMAGCTILV